MKRMFVLLGLGAVIITSVSSCATANRSMKRDCQGAKHYRLKNGIYI